MQIAKMTKIIFRQRLLTNIEVEWNWNIEISRNLRLNPIFLDILKIFAKFCLLSNLRSEYIENQRMCMKIFRKFDLQGKKFQKRFIPTNIKPEKWKFLESLLFFYFGHIFVKFCSNSLILDIFEWPKYPRYGNLRYIQLCEFFCLPLFSTCTPTLHIQSTMDNALKTHR